MNKYGFRFQDKLPKRFAGLSIDLVSELYDAVVNYGQEVAGAPLRRLCIQLPGGRVMNMTAVVPTEPRHKRNIVVGLEIGFLRTANLAVIYIDERVSFLAVEEGYSLEDLQVGLRSIDEQMSAVGAYDRLTGTRKRVVYDRFQAIVKLQVSKEFAHPFSVVRLILTGETDDQVREMFDHPDEVAVLRNNGEHAEVTTRQGYLALRDATIEVMKSYGISDPDELEGFSEERLTAFRDDLSKAIAKRLASRN